MLVRLSRFSSALARFEIYEIAGIFMALLTVAIFISFPRRLHAVFAVGRSPFLLVDNLLGVFSSPYAWLFSIILPLMLAAYYYLRSNRCAKITVIRFFIRVLMSFCLMMAIYKIVNFYIDVFNPFDKDVILQHIDRTLFFGKLPSEWIEPLVTPALTYVFFTAYMSWFILQYVTLVVLFKHSKRAVHEYVTAAIITFYIGYITYSIVPAIGPIFTVHYQTSLGTALNLLNSGETSLSRDCFPSLHTGISIVMLLYIRRYRKDLFPIYLFATLMIIVSTQYLRVHYGIDVIAGAALGLGICQCAPFWMKRWEIYRSKVLTEQTKQSSVPNADSLSELV